MRLIPKDEDLGWTPYAWLVYVTFVFAQPVMRGTAESWAMAIGAVSLFLVLYFRGYWTHGRQMIGIVAAIALLGALYYPINPGAGCFFIYACSFAAWIGTTRQAVVAMSIIETVTVVESVAFHIHPMNSAWPIVFNIIVGAINIHFAERDRVNAKLRLAHDEVEHLAKVAERERIARDLHDLLGHTLSLIILKSELASKLGERDPERARSEIRDVERISRDALAQVRAAVRGYRTGGLQSEIDAAVKALETANVSVTRDVAPTLIPPQYEAVLALATREAVTNIVRHAAATHVTIRFTAPCTLTIEDDGRGGDADFGSGLAGMRERVEALGGMLVRDGSRGTRITISLPLTSDDAGASLTTQVGRSA